MNKSQPKALKAYKNSEFLNSPAARTIRMLAEYLEPQRRFVEEEIEDTIVFFGSARIRPRKETLAKLRIVQDVVGRAERPTKALLQKMRDAEVQVEMSRYYEDCSELARQLTEWSKRFTHPHRFVICSGGGPGIMEAANRGATLAKGKSIGLNISLPFEQTANGYITPHLNFDFHYFFMRKLWFTDLAKALVAFPGGFGTFDELMEVLTLLQTKKITKDVAVILYGSDYWKKVVDFDEMVRHGVVSAEDLSLFKFIDSPEEAFRHLKGFLTEKYLRPDKKSKKMRKGKA